MDKESTLSTTSSPHCLIIIINELFKTFEVIKMIQYVKRKPKKKTLTEVSGFKSHGSHHQKFG